MLPVGSGFIAESSSAVDACSVAPSRGPWVSEWRQAAPAYPSSTLTCAGFPGWALGPGCRGVLPVPCVARTGGVGGRAVLGAPKPV